jgi:FKBP-type peptidyl-prolyl cis-trans isomerase FkpA
MTRATRSPQHWSATVSTMVMGPGRVNLIWRVVYRSLKDGTGASPKASDSVRVHCRVTFPDGKEFDSSYKRGQPIDFPLNGVIKCWTEGVQKMKVGGKARLTCPPSIAYSAAQAGSAIGPRSGSQSSSVS